LAYHEEGGFEMRDEIKKKYFLDDYFYDFKWLAIRSYLTYILILNHHLNLHGHMKGKIKRCL
jgi:hypothetical protein